MHDCSYRYSFGRFSSLEKPKTFGLDPLANRALQLSGPFSKSGLQYNCIMEIEDSVDNNHAMMHCPIIDLNG